MFNNPTHVATTIMDGVKNFNVTLESTSCHTKNTRSSLVEVHQVKGFTVFGFQRVFPYIRIIYKFQKRHLEVWRSCLRGESDFFFFKLFQSELFFFFCFFPSNFCSFSSSSFFSLVCLQTSLLLLLLQISGIFFQISAANSLIITGFYWPYPQGKDHSSIQDSVDKILACSS